MMSCLPFLVFSTLLLVPIESKGNVWPTEFNVPFKLTCNGSFFYNITLYEYDWIKDDVIATIAQHSTDVATGTLTGLQTDDGIGDGGVYEPYIRIEHTCENNPRRADRELTEPKCKINTTRCDYPEQVWNL